MSYRTSFVTLANKKRVGVGAHLSITETKIYDSVKVVGQNLFIKPANNLEYVTAKMKQVQALLAKNKDKKVSEVIKEVQAITKSLRPATEAEIKVYRTVRARMLKNAEDQYERKIKRQAANTQLEIKRALAVLKKHPDAIKQLQEAAK